MRLQRVDDRIAVHYSQASIRAHWMFDSRADGDTWPRRFSSYEASHSRFARVRDSFVRVVQDLGLQYRFLAYRAGGAGRAIHDVGDPTNFGGIGSYRTLKPGEPDYETVKKGYLASSAVAQFISSPEEKWMAVEGNEPSGLPKRSPCSVPRVQRWPRALRSFCPSVHRTP